MLLFFKPTPIYYYLGQIAIQVTSDAHCPGAFHVFANYPAYSSSKFYSFYYFFIHNEKWPWLEPSMNPLLSTPISVIAIYVC